MVTMIMATKWIFFSFRFSYQSEISCGLFSLDAKAMEKSSAQVV